MQIYYIDKPDICLPCEVHLDVDESYHCIRVLRLQVNDNIQLTDGHGNLFSGIILNNDVKKCAVRLESVVPEFGKRPFRLHLAVAPTKNIARFEWFLEKATEIGVDEITPLLCERSERIQLRIDRLRKIILAAAKQSLHTYLPTLNEAVDFTKFVHKPQPGNKFIAWAGGQNPVHLKTASGKGDSLVLIGPEGDFTDAELELAEIQGFRIVSLGNSRLRTETAALVACHTINLLNC